MTTSEDRRPATKDVSTLLVLRAIAQYRARGIGTFPASLQPPQLLMQWTSAPEKVCLAAMEREYRRGFIEAGVGVSVGWLTDEGVAELARLEAADNHQNQGEKKQP